MVIGNRILERMQSSGLSQAELARRVGISQQAIGKLVHGRSRKTTHIARLARELNTTPSYLEGDIDDPGENVPAPPRREPTVQYVTMKVALPSENALARMFAGLLRSIDPKASLDEQAQLLAKRLPIGLSQLQGPLIEVPADDPQQAPSAAEPPAKRHPELQPARHT